MGYMTKSDHFEAWCYYYMTQYIKCPFADFHKEWFKLIFEHDRVAIAAPRRFAKTHTISIFYALFYALENPGSSIIVVSATVGFAIERVLAKIKYQLESNGQLIEDYGDQKTTRWSSERLMLKNGSIIEAKGAGGQIRGIGNHLIIVDDIEDDEEVLSEDQRKKLDNWFWKALIGTTEPECRVVVVGTLLHPLSFLTLMIEQGRPGWVCRKYQASDWPITYSAWPRRWPVAALIKMADERGSAAYKSELMNEPIPDELRLFGRDDFKYWTEIPHGCSYSITIDPAATVKNRSDYTAIVVCATDHHNTIHVVDYTRRRMLPNEIMDEIFRLDEKYHPRVIGIETVGFQNLLKYIFELECRKRRRYPNIQELALDVSERGRKKRFRIEALQPYIKKGKMLLGPNMSELEGELLSFPVGRYDDLVDALASQLEIVTPGSIMKAEGAPRNSFISVLQERKKRNHKIRPWHKRHSGVTY